MSYRLEGKDIVISGFENGISEDPYKGIADMRNVDPNTVPGEVSVAFRTIQSSHTGLTGNVISADPTTDIVTVSGITGTLFNGMALTFAGGSLPTGIVAGTVYFVGSLSGSTFKLYTKPDLLVGNLLDITLTGTGTLASVNMGKVKFFAQKPTNVTGTITYEYYALDTNGRPWYWNGTNWIYLNLNASSGRGLAYWEDYLFVWGTSQFNLISTTNILSNSWTVNWLPDGANTPRSAISHAALVGQDNVLYYCDNIWLGSLQLANPNVAFDPANNTTYIWARTALSLPGFESAVCLAELGVNLLVGGIGNAIYPWDRVSPSFSYPILLSDSYIQQMVTVNTNTYIFAGNRGKIYVTNGAQAQLYKKLPDNLAGIPNPYYTWGGASYSRDSIFFGVQATNNAGTAINQFGGLWQIDLSRDAMVQLNQLSYGDYTGAVSAIIPRLTNITLAGGTNQVGYSLFIGWNGGIDTYDGNPYTAGQSIIDCDMIPIGTYLKPFTPSQVEWKTSTPLVAGESIALYYRTNLTGSYTLIPTETTSLVGAISDQMKTNFEKVQWLQMRAVLTSTTTTPSYCRLTEIRIRDYPST